MVIGIIGENCSGKSSLAKEIANAIGAEIITGKDYLRAAKSESEAKRLFMKRLQDAVNGENVIYVISEKEHSNLLPNGAIRILIKADIDTVMSRFRDRLHGNLPEPVAQMLLRKHGMFDDGEYDYTFDGAGDDYSEICAFIKNKI